MNKQFKIKIIVEFDGRKIEKESTNHHIANLNSEARYMCLEINKDLYKRYGKASDEHPWYYQ